MPKKIETVVLSFQEYMDAKDNKVILPRYFIVDAMGNYVFIRTRDRSKAQSFVNEEYGERKYTVRTQTQDGVASGDASCRATETRKGQHVRNESFGIFRGIN